MRWIILLVLAVSLLFVSIAYADYYTDSYGNVIEVGDNGTNCQPVLYNGQFQGTVEHIPTGSETLDRIMSEANEDIGNYAWE